MSAEICKNDVKTTTENLCENYEIGLSQHGSVKDHAKIPYDSNNETARYNCTCSHSILGSKIANIDARRRT